ncbi:bZIP-2 multi-domain protein [Pyrenophora tritici-repentis]|nr:bZIP-2 multi-domain protein [Pyrenophora tritici-repentis]KAG9379507.1 bZIP-2 multi-domain protein [Pyrenophora tritici-repentis]KAI1584022.1 bZIP-2 multi-domain protein [Pyrenophora tritici-repentis]KAI1593758.1 bZIP-2 multi-domain protein [Pyrenophora tritici-repentis]
MAEQHTFDSTLFSQTITNPAMISTPLPPPQQEAMMPTTIKLEMIEGYDNSPSPAQHSSSSSEPSHTPAPESQSGSKPVKKRKSWGQVLPEPKTSLPPRKRAKTEDEKEQRRIERVKRNRLAAHNSRERKRQEYEVLQTEKDELEASMQAYKQKMAQMEAELNFYRSKYPGETPQPVFDLSTPPTEPLDTICPAQIPTSFPSPESMDSMDSPRDSSCQPETPNSSFEFTSEFDSTQYSAAVLCDLQCQSNSGTSLPAIFAYLSLFNLTIQSTRSPPWKTSSTSTKPQSVVQQPLLQWSPLLLWWTLLQSISSTQTCMNKAFIQTLTGFWTALMQSSTTCRVPLAQLRLATRPSQRDNFSIEAVLRLSEGLKDQAESVKGDCGSRLTRSSKSRQLGGRKNGSLRLDRVLGWENWHVGSQPGVGRSLERVSCIM